MQTVKRRDGWWIENVPECEDCGPYSTRKQADSDMRGMERFFKFEDKKHFVTTEKVKRVSKSVVCKSGK